jgi:hypothetical protein
MTRGMVPSQFYKLSDISLINHYISSQIILPKALQTVVSILMVVTSLLHRLTSPAQAPSVSHPTGA